MAHKMLLKITGLAQSMEERMRGFLINKNLCLYFCLKKKIGKKCALGMANAIEKALLIFGREVVLYFNRNRTLTEEQ